MTFDTATLKLTLFVNGEQQGQVDAPMYAPNATQPLWIGAGAPFVAPRPQPDDKPRARFRSCNGGSRSYLPNGVGVVLFGSRGFASSGWPATVVLSSALR